MLALIIVALAAGPSEQIRVGVTHFPPMVYVDKTGAVSGSDIDMYTQLTNDPAINWKRDIDYEYVVVNSFEALMSQVEEGKIDQALNGISITSERLSKMHFSQPYMSAGHRIMVPFKNPRTNIFSYLSRFFRWEIFYALVVFVLSCLVWGGCMFVVEKFCKRPSGVEVNIKTVEHGALAAFDASTTIGFGRHFPVTRIGQIVAIGTFFCGAMLVGDVISTLTTNKIVQKFEGEINDPTDLKRKSIAVVSGTTSESVVQEYNPAIIVPCDDFYKAVVELRLGNVDALVADDPVVRNYVKENPTHGVLVGVKFHIEDYGIAFSSNVTHTTVEMFSIAIAKLRESGRLALIEKQWLGE